jgi:hypothetical protein
VKNDWLCEGADKIRIALKRGGRRGTGHLWVTISREDFDKVDAFPGSWVAKWNETAHTFYARHNRGFGWACGYMHRLILGVTDRSVCVDHLDHNGLHNWRGNLAVSNRKLNGFNRRGADVGSVSGRRNVYWNNREQKYMVWFVYNGKRYYFGYFTNIDEADQVAQKERERFL